MTDPLSCLENCPHLQRIVDAQLVVWPEHRDYLQQGFGNMDPSVLTNTEEMAGLVTRLVGDQMEAYCQDYQWMCGNFMRADVDFRKTGTYLLSSFAEAYEQVYGNAAYMSRYIQGILFSQLLWSNQAVAFAYYVDSFLPIVKEGDEFLEIGPGHGLLLYYAAKIELLKSITGWDVSQSSLAATGEALKTLGVERPINLISQNILEAPARTDAFDAVVFSEVLEHLDYPDVALKNVLLAMRPGGHMFLNVPVNSPAPDHIFLWHSPEEVVDLVKDCGFEVVDTRFVPATGFTEEEARRRKVTINSLVIAKKPLS
ncbi:class I SAM-dependent methyltransferase [Acidimicrobium ferrooxidans]|nr:class I SAM-dependent methyltransferase [Acidimicrobium ferrooxidans]